MGSAAWAQERLILLPNEGEPRWLSAEAIRKVQHDMHLQGRCGGFMDVTETWSVFKSIEPRYLPLFAIDGADPQRQDIVNPRLAELNVEKMRSTVAALSNFETRHYRSKTGIESSAWIQKQFEDLSAGRSDIDVRTFGHSFSQPSVIATIQGKGPHASERVIVGAHQDSINMWFQTRAPGADDDASGIATILEIFRVLAQSGFQPERTIQFMAYAGEEAGLLGSADISAKYAKEKKDVVAVVQFDMTMFPSKSRTLTFISDNVNPELTQFLTKVQDTYVKKPWKTTKCGYACSDHASWTRAGYKSVFPFESPFDETNPSIHSKNDVLATLDVEYGLQFAQLGLAAAIELSMP